MSLPRLRSLRRVPKLPRGQNTTTDPDSAWRRSARRFREWAPPAARGRFDYASDPSPAPGAMSSNAQGLEAGDAPWPQKLAALQKSWTNFSGDDGCGRGEWDWGSRAHAAGPKGKDVGGEAAEPSPTPASRSRGHDA